MAATSALPSPSSDTYRPIGPYYRALLEQIPAAVYLADRAGRMHCISDRIEAVTGRPVADWLASADFWLTQVDEADRERVAAIASEAFEAGLPWEAEYAMTSADGRRLRIRHANVPIAGGPDARLCRQGLITDLTPVTATPSVAKDEESIALLAGGIAHDFNNLMMVMVCHLDLLLDRVGLNAPVRHDLLEVRNAAHSATRMARQFLEITRHRTPAPRRLDLTATVAGIRETLKNAVSPETVVVFDLAEGLPRITADRSQIERLVMNLVVNARDAVGAGGRITVATDAPDPCRVRLRVSDTGPGIPEEIRARIFEPFFTTKDADKGTGLGLATVQTIVMQSAGTIDIATAPGAGTSVIVTLPTAGQGQR